jgi:hypothetical protein
MHSTSTRRVQTTTNNRGRAASPGPLSFSDELPFTRMKRRLQNAFPRVCASRVEDAFQAAWLSTLTQPTDYQALGTLDAQLKLFYTVAWRSLRGDCRRASYRMEMGIAELDAVWGHSPGQENAYSFRCELPKMLELAAAEAGTAHPEAIQQALEDQLCTGDTDAHAASRAGVRRDSLCRARRRAELYRAQRLSC